MSSPSVPDPYLALGLPKDATATQIKATYRKAALKYHPDKVTDESLKASAADQFHRIQQAYEILGDEDRRGRYDAQVRLAELRKDVLDRQAAKGDVRTAAFGVPTTSPGRATYKERGPERRTEEVRPAGYFDSDNDYFGSTRASSRKHADYDRDFRTYSPKDDADRIKVSARQSKENDKASRRDSRRVSEKDRRKDRDSKRHTPYVEDDSDSDDYASTVKRSDRREEDKYSKKQKDYSGHDSYYDSDHSRNLYSTENNIRDYISRSSRGGSEKRPSAAPRSSSARYPDVDVRRNSEGPPVMVRRSSAQPTTTKRESSRRTSGRERERERQRSVPEEEIMESLRRPATLQTANSSPAAIKVPSQDARRGQTLPSKYDTPEHAHPAFRRSETMPNVSTSRRKDTVPQKSSTLRQTEINEGLPTPSTTPDYPDAYPVSAKYRSSGDEAYRSSGPRRTEVYEPDTPRRSTRGVTHSPEPVGRQTRSSATRPALHPLRTDSSSYAPRVVSESPTTYSRPSPSRHNSERPLYGELPSISTKHYAYPDTLREKDRYRFSPDPENVTYVKPVGRDDVKMASGGYQVRHTKLRPAVGRTASSAY